MSLVSECPQQDFEAIVKTSFSYAECLRKIGYSANSGDATKMLKNRIQELNLDISHFNQTSLRKRVKRSPENIFIQNSTANQATLRKWYIKGNYSEYICSICGQLPEWQNKPMTLILDHINGDNHDDRLENLRWVCPNCNQQLPTTNGKNQNKTKKEKDIQKKDWKKEQVKNICPICGGCKSINAKMCYRCRNSINSIPVNKKELQQLLFDNKGNFTQTGKQFNVTGNAIVKWCKKYELPYHSADYKPTKEKRSGQYGPKAVYKIDKDSGEILDKFNSITEAGKSVGINNPTHICNVCKGSRKTAYGYKWKYAED